MCRYYNFIISMISKLLLPQIVGRAGEEGVNYY